MRPKPLRDPRFVLDVHLGRLAAYLRMLGFDTLYQNRCADDCLAEVARNERRILLTRDVGLLKRGSVTHGYYLRATAGVKWDRILEAGHAVFVLQMLSFCNGRYANLGLN